MLFPQFTAAFTTLGAPNYAERGHLDWNRIDAMVQEGETDKIVGVEDEAEHKTTEVWLE